MSETHIKIEGSLIFSAPDAKQKLREATGKKHVILDFSGVDFIDSTGLDMIVMLYKKLKDKGGTLKLENVKSDIYQMFDVSGLRHLVEIHRLEKEKQCQI